MFCGGPGATGRSYSDEPTILRSIRDRLLTLHGDTTTIDDERQRVLARITELGLAWETAEKVPDWQSRFAKPQVRGFCD